MTTSGYSKYGPEDFEELLLHKTFEELLEEEKAYVLLYLNTPEEYEGMRSLLLSTCEKQPTTEDIIKPRKATKEKLLKRFSEQHRTERLALLNTWATALFSFQPNARLALGVLTFLLLIVSGIIAFYPFTGKTELQANKEQPVIEDQPAGHIDNPVLFKEGEQDFSGTTPGTDHQLARPEETTAENKTAQNNEISTKPKPEVNNKIAGTIEPGQEQNPETDKANRELVKGNLASSNLAEHLELMQLLYTEL